jgi:hypothetical protein
MVIIAAIRKVGPRSHVWTEKEMIEECANEFAEVT